MTSHTRRPRPPVWEQGRSKNYQLPDPGAELPLPSMRRMILSWSLITLGALLLALNLIVNFVFPAWPGSVAVFAGLGCSIAGQVVISDFRRTRTPVWRTSGRTRTIYLLVGVAGVAWLAVLALCIAVPQRDHAAALGPLIALAAILIASELAAVLIQVSMVGRKPGDARE